MKYLLILIVLSSCNRGGYVTQRFDGYCLETVAWDDTKSIFIDTRIHTKKDCSPITKELIERRKMEANIALEDYKRINRLIND